MRVITTVTLPPTLSVRSTVLALIRLRETVVFVFAVPLIGTSLPSKLAVYWLSVFEPSVATPAVVTRTPGPRPRLSTSSSVVQDRD